MHTHAHAHARTHTHRHTYTHTCTHTHTHTHTHNNIIYQHDLKLLEFILYIDDLKLLEKLVWRHNILTEEVEGIRNCTISLHNLIHLPSDIERFSTPDNVWCYVFERAVHTYIERSSNKKNLELTFARAQSRRELLKFLPTKDDCIQERSLQQVIYFIYIYIYYTYAH